MAVATRDALVHNMNEQHEMRCATTTFGVVANTKCVVAQAYPPPLEYRGGGGVRAKTLCQEPFFPASKLCWSARDVLQHMRFRAQRLLRSAREMSWYTYDFAMCHNDFRAHGIVN